MEEGRPVFVGEVAATVTLQAVEPIIFALRACLQIFGQASGVPGPPPMVWSGRGGGGGGRGAGVREEWSGQLGGVLLCATRGHREGRDLTQALCKP